MALLHFQASFLAVVLYSSGCLCIPTAKILIQSNSHLLPLSPVALIGLVQELVTEGLIKGIGLSEISAADIRKAHAVHPITAVEMEWSLFSRDAEVCIGV